MVKNQLMRSISLLFQPSASTKRWYDKQIKLKNPFTSKKQRKDPADDEVLLSEKFLVSDDTDNDNKSIHIVEHSTDKNSFDIHKPIFYYFHDKHDLQSSVSLLSTDSYDKKVEVILTNENATLSDLSHLSFSTTANDIIHHEVVIVKKSHISLLGEMVQGILCDAISIADKEFEQEEIVPKQALKD
ncbi:uncharacterized protein BX663DRAFT_522869 [Cokeromyces recurvatus]|uniref:uncharacterized protein n=1 Tax=Cokeromyces recurvatus TaxID=90255 RepID=UPI00221E70D3|nr:uncharacterized protein BX663DRAFT_522869 [Cokeromyces recurvatus]KAI7899023.1 hypothetical protein BX663DRAFT_522869 [Cokeromyces recurvatus]